MRLALCCTVSIFLFGCATSLQGTGLPTPGDVAGFADDTASHAVIANAPGGPRPLTAGEYLASSITLTNERCSEFFDALEKVRQDSSFVDKVLQAAAGIAATAKATDLAASLIGANLVNTTVADVYAFSSVKDQLKRHVQQDQEQYLTDRNLILGLVTGDVAAPEELTAAIQAYRAYEDGREVFGASVTTAAGRQLLMRLRFFYSTKPLDLLIARNLAAGYAAICSIGHMRGIIIASLDRTSEAKDKNQEEANVVRGMRTATGEPGIPRPVTSNTAPTVPSLSRD